MIISILNKKGGVGKTPFAFSIAKDLSLYLQSNDTSCIEQIYPNYAVITDTPKLIDNCVYDFGGFKSAGVLKIISESDYVVVPCLPEFNSLLRTMETIDEIKKINPNIIILATDYKDNAELSFLKENLEKNFKNIPIIYFKSSKIVKNAINSGKSFIDAA